MAHKYTNTTLEECEKLNIPSLTHTECNDIIDYIYSLYPTTYNIPIMLQVALKKWLGDYKTYFHMKDNLLFDYDVSSMWVIIIGIPKAWEKEILTRLHDMLEPNNLNNKNGISESN